MKLNFGPFFLMWLFSILFLLTSFAFCIFYVLPVGSRSGSKYFPGMNHVCFAITINPPSEPQQGCAGVFYKTVDTVKVTYRRFTVYCATFPMKVMAGIDFMMLAVLIAIIVQGEAYFSQDVVYTDLNTI